LSRSRDFARRAVNSAIRPPSTPALWAVSIAAAASSRRSSSKAFLRLGPQPFLNLGEAAPCAASSGLRANARRYKIECVVVVRRGEAILRKGRVGAHHRR